MAIGNASVVSASRENSPADWPLAYLLLRVTLGLNIFMHGFSRILAGASQFAAGMDKMFAQTWLPAWQVHAFGLSLPWIEVVLGLLLLVGLRTRTVLVAGALWIALLTFGTTVRQDWQSAGLQLIYAVTYAGLLAACRWNRYSIDGLILRRKVNFT